MGNQVAPKDLEKFYAYVDELCADIFSFNHSSQKEADAKKAQNKGEFEG